MVASDPFVVIATKSDGKKLLWTGYRAGHGTTKLRYLLLGYGRNVELVDARGVHYANARIASTGVSWWVYRKAGPIGLIVALLSIPFLAVLVDFKVVEFGGSKEISLEEFKEMLKRAVASNESSYTHASPSEVMGRIGRSKDFESAIRAIYRD